jgi:cytoskeletal protein CcmA (bactofilin family)
MFFKKVNKINSRIDTLVGTDTVVSGDIIFSGGLRIDGNIRGDVREQAGTQGTVVVGENGCVEGAVSATKIVLIGSVVGTVKASQFIELQSKARIKGTLYYKSLEMHVDSVIDGNLVHNEENETDEPV